jgi:hypothetical protein
VLDTKKTIHIQKSLLTRNSGAAQQLPIRIYTYPSLFGGISHIYIDLYIKLSTFLAKWLVLTLFGRYPTWLSPKLVCGILGVDETHTWFA